MVIVKRHTLKKTLLRPKRDISRLTGRIVSAVPTTIIATGRVERFLKSVSELPIIPPTKTMNTATDINNAELIANNQTFFGS